MGFCCLHKFKVGRPRKHAKDVNGSKHHIILTKSSKKPLNFSWDKHIHIIYLEVMLYTAQNIIKHFDNDLMLTCTWNLKQLQAPVVDFTQQLSYRLVNKPHV